MLLNGQTYKDDIRVIMEAMSSSKNYAYRVHYKLYLDDNLDKAFQESYTDVKKNEEGIFYKKNNGIEFMSNSKCELLLDENAHSITAKYKQKSRKNKEEKFLEDALKNLDSLLSNYDKIKIIKKENNKVTYLLQPKGKQAIRNIKVIIDRDKRRVMKMQYSYNAEMNIPELKNSKHSTIFEISYEDLKIDNPINKRVFDEKKYILLVNGKTKLTTRYKDYTLYVLN